jgi:hypothetical protein
MHIFSMQIFVLGITIVKYELKVRDVQTQTAYFVLVLYFVNMLGTKLLK